MTGGDETCWVGWCDELAEHEGPHRRPLFDTLAFDVNAGPLPLMLFLQGESVRVRVPVIVVGPVELGLTWAAADALAGALTSARRSYGGQ